MKAWVSTHLPRAIYQPSLARCKSKPRRTVAKRVRREKPRRPSRGRRRTFLAGARFPGRWPGLKSGRRVAADVRVHSTSRKRKRRAGAVSDPSIGAFRMHSLSLRACMSVRMPCSPARGGQKTARPNGPGSRGTRTRRRALKGRPKRRITPRILRQPMHASLRIRPFS